jgi:GT2 family glycosyltransferase
MSEGAVRDICLSIVSHGQANLTRLLLQDLSTLSSNHRFFVVLTLNIPEEEVIHVHGYAFPIYVIENSKPQGFGANHNQAFQTYGEKASFFFVLNPDLRIKEDIFSGCSALLERDSRIGVVAPKVVNEHGAVEDSMRELPTLFILGKKLLGKYHDKQEVYCEQDLCYPDWVAGMCMGFRQDTFVMLDGFDEAYFLYYEDVDLCSRIWLSGKKVCVQQQYQVIHQAQRESHRNLRYMKWHIRSILRFLISSVYRRVKRVHQQRALR